MRRSWNFSLPASGEIYTRADDDDDDDDGGGDELTPLPRQREKEGGGVGIAERCRRTPCRRRGWRWERGGSPVNVAALPMIFQNPPSHFSMCNKSDKFPISLKGNSLFSLPTCRYTAAWSVALHFCVWYCSEPSSITPWSTPLVQCYKVVRWGFILRRTGSVSHVWPRLVCVLCDVT